MITVTTITELRSLVIEERINRRTVGLVPTMGAFHEGHLSLMRQAREQTDFVIVSLFVNPTQFGEGEDFEAYPRDEERDQALAEETGVNVVFAPAVEEIYPPEFSTYVEVEGSITSRLEGALRPNHFKGVTTVVAKLFDIVGPDMAYFGQKDLQQAYIVKRMAGDLNMPVEVILCPTAREADGLAMSSRNVYLSPEERKAATVLFRSLSNAEHLVQEGERHAHVIKEAVREVVAAEPLADLQYAEVCDTINLDNLDEIETEAAVLLAVKIGKTRLIDNMIVRRP